MILKAKEKIRKVEYFEVDVVAGGRTRPLRCCAILGLSSASCRWCNMDCLAAGIVSIGNLVRQSDYIYAILFASNIRGAKSRGRQVPVERHGHPRPCKRKGPTKWEG